MLTNNWFSRYTQNDYTSHDKGYYHRILEYSSRVQAVSYTHLTLPTKA